MGMCQNKEVREQLLVNKKIENALKKEQDESSGQVKLLLLGSGECGKSTILKQMQILHKNGFSEEEILEKRDIIHANVVTSMATMLRAMDNLRLTLEDPEHEVDCKLVYNTVDAGNTGRLAALSEEMCQALERLWSDSGVKEAYNRRNEYQLADSIKYFLDSLDRIKQPDYRPTEQDILYTRVATTGVIEVIFAIKGLRFKVFDVGGQRSERRKWIHCFDNVDAIIFISAISEYNQMLYEDDKTNRMQESMQLFESICNSAWFQNTSIILFLNKKDLFEEKLAKFPLKIAFPNYEGSQEFEECVDYIKARFQELNRVATKFVYAHVTCATDKDQVQLVLNGVLDSIIQKNLSAAGVM